MTETAPATTANVRQAVPFLMVTDMAAALRFYVDGLGAELRNTWTPEGRIEWCWLALGDAALMLQEYRPGKRPEGTLGLGVSTCFMCRDAIALYHEFRARGVEAERPFVGNGLWVTSVKDPDGHRIDFESPTDVPEGTEYGGT
jgi:lactoylglutathione lyase